MNRVTAEEVARMAAKEAVEEYARSLERAARTKVLHNTKVLMENYNNIKSHVEEGIADTLDLEEDIDADGIDTDELFIYSIKRSKLRSMIMISHIDRCLKLLEREEYSRNVPEKYLAYKYFYIDNMSYESIAEVYGYNERTARRWVKELDKTMSVYLFGGDALHIM